jgi:hypothetical protein
LDMSLSEQLYTPDGSGRAWVGTLYKTYIGALSPKHLPSQLLNAPRESMLTNSLCRCPRTGIRDTAGRFMWSFSGQTGNPDDTGTADGGNNGGTNGGQNSNTAFVYAPPFISTVLRPEGKCSSCRAQCMIKHTHVVATTTARPTRAGRTRIVW